MLVDLGGPCDTAGCDRESVVGFQRSALCLWCYEIALVEINEALERLIATFQRTHEDEIRSPLLCGDDEDP